MKRDFSAVVKDHDGVAKVRSRFKYDPKTGMPVCDEKGVIVFSHYEAMTLRLYALDALANRWDSERGEDVERSQRRTKLHDKLAFSPDGTVELDGPEAQMILDALKAQGREHLVIGRMKEMLDADPPATQG